MPRHRRHQSIPAAIMLHTRAARMNVTIVVIIIHNRQPPPMLVCIAKVCVIFLFLMILCNKWKSKTNLPTANWKLDNANLSVVIINIKYESKKSLKIYLQHFVLAEKCKTTQNIGQINILTVALHFSAKIKCQIWCHIKRIFRQT